MKSEINSRKQLAIAVAKGKRVELTLLQNACRGASQMQFQTTIEYRIHKLNQQIEVLEGNLIIKKGG